MFRVIFLLLLLVVMTARATAADGEAISKAIDKGAAYLKAQQREQGTWPQHENGGTALAALALLESGVKADDPAITKAAAAIRDAVPTAYGTYTLALSIMFLERLGDSRDVPLIESLGVRLLAGQRGNGGWSYTCPANHDSEVKRLREIIRNREKGSAPARSGEKKRTVKELPQELQTLLEDMQALRKGQDFQQGGDNSNTQFAVMGLWLARRYGVPVQDALVDTYQRFASGQNADGGWGYLIAGNRDNASTPSMTCAGLFALAAGYGSVQESREEKQAKPLPPIEKEKVVKIGLSVLGGCIDHPIAKKKGAARVPEFGAHAGKAYYFFYSLERTALVFGLDTIGGKDWYSWGAEIIVANQLPDGSWQGDYSAGGADTAFALLFLRRSHLARDLTLSVQGKVTDPGETILKPGGVGGEALLGQGIKPAIDPEDLKPPPKPPDDPEAVRLGARLTDGVDEVRAAALEKLKAGKGAAYTLALATATARLDGEWKKKAREALAERLSGLTDGTLRQWLKSEDAEIRRAAVLACAMKDDAGSGAAARIAARVADVIDRLDDPDPSVVRAALAALKSLTGEDFGPPKDATDADRARAVQLWKDWFNKQAAKKRD